jgi:ubiquinone/menaquinone biosynthesis C-methylase UbiE
MEDLGHSELYFSDYRDFWYNEDFIELMAKRWGLGQYSTLLDIGAGLCHWSQLLAPYLKHHSSVTAYDNDPKWSGGNDSLKAKFNSISVDLSFVKGDAQNLPFADNSFDVVTCQTVLIHLKDPKQALLEMKRVVKKEGIVICAEPNNVVGNLIKDTITKNESLPEKLEAIQYALLYERGKINQEEGDNSFGDLLTGVMNEVGFVNLQTYLNDKVIPLYPPYTKAEQKAMIETMKLWEKEKGTFNDEGRKYFQTMGEESLQFSEYFLVKNTTNKVLKQIEQNDYSSGGATVMYLVSGNK